MELGTLCGNLGFKEAVGVRIYEVDYTVMKFGVGVVHFTALYHPIFCQ